MIGTADKELASVKTESSWKTVTKGCRSGTRRPRKTNKSLNMGLPHNDKGTKKEYSVGESEKFGVAALGNRFSENLDHLPIKKRRLLQQSLPPPPPPRTHINQLDGDLRQETKSLDTLVAVISSCDEKSRLNIQSPSSLDSYGIELLAAAACNTKIDEDVHDVKAVKLEENFETFSRSGSSIHATLLEENNGGSHKEKEKSLLKDFKLENHAADQNNYPVVSENIQNMKDSEIGNGSSSVKDIRLHWDLNIVMDEWELPPGNTLSLNCPSEIDISAQVFSKSKSPMGSDPTPSEFPLLEKLNMPTTMMSVKVKDHSLSSDLQLGQTLALQNVQLEKQGVAMIESTISKDIGNNVVRLDKNSDSSNDKNTKNLAETTFVVKDHSSKSGKVSPSAAKDRESAEKKDLDIPPRDGASADSSSEVEVKKLEHKRFDRFHEDALDDLLDDGDVSDYSPSGHHHLHIIENMSKYHSGYESPVEDGELREPYDHSWQENEGETDCLDYDASGKHDFSKESSHSVTTGNSSGRIQNYKGREHVKTVEENNMELGELGDFDSRVKGSLEEKVGSRATRGKLSTYPRNVHRSSEDYFRGGQVYRSDKFGRDDDVSGGNWGSRNHYQKGYRRGGGNPGLRSNNSPGANDDQLAYDYQRRSRGSYKKGGYLLDRRPLDDNHNSIDRENFATTPTRDDKYYRGRGRSGFYRRGGYVKDNISEYHNHSSNDPTPFYRRGSSFSRPRRNSPSRSRTRSPVPWHLQRERTVGPKRTSRSPNFRSECRMGRNRMHYGDSTFSENEDGSLSPPRRRFFNDQKSGPGHFKERNSPGRFFCQRQRFGSNGCAGRMKNDDDGFRPRLNSERFSEQSRGGWRGRNKNYNGSDSDRKRYNSKHEMTREVRRSESRDAGRRFRSDTGNCFGDNDNRNGFNNKNSSIRSTDDKLSSLRSTEKSDAPGDEGNLLEGGKGQLKCDSDSSFKLPESQRCEEICPSVEG